MPLNPPKGYKSKDVYDRRQGQGKTLGERVYDAKTYVRSLPGAVKEDYDEMKKIEARKRATKR